MYVGSISVYYVSPPICASVRETQHKRKSAVRSLVKFHIYIIIRTIVSLLNISEISQELFIQYNYSIAIFIHTQKRKRQ